MTRLLRQRPLWLLVALLALLALARTGRPPEPGANTTPTLQRRTPTQAMPQEPMPYDLAPVTQLVESAVNAVPLSGASLLLLHRGQVIYERAFGGYTIDTAVNIASGSKWLTAATIMTLVDDGLLTLDEPISRRLPEFTGDAAAITLRQLLSHTSGLPDYHPSLDDDTISLAESVRQIAGSGLSSTPGRAFHYGNVSFQVAGRLAEVAAGKPWVELFEERIKRPLGLIVTTYEPTRNPFLAGGVTTTLREYGRFLQMQLDDGVYAGQRVLTYAALRQMQRDQTFGAPIEASLHNDGRRYGLGQWRDIVDAEGHAIQASSQGDTGFSPWIDYQRRLAGVFLVYDYLGNVQSYVDRIQEQVRSIIDSTPASQPATHLPGLTSGCELNAYPHIPDAGAPIV